MPLALTPMGLFLFFSQIEGVIVECCTGHSTFTPLSTHLFSAYIDFTSIYNLFSNQDKGTQTGKSSNLYQIDHGNTQENYNRMYLFSSSEIDATESST
jgi:hypothetical protein